MALEVTTGEFIGVVSLLAPVVLVIVRTEYTSRRNKEIGDTAMKIAHDTARGLADFQLQITREYASIRHLQEVESRLTTAIGKLENQIDSLPERIAKALKG